MSRRTVGSPAITLRKRAKKHRQDACELCATHNSPARSDGVLKVANVWLCENHALTLCLIVASNDRQSGVAGSRGRKTGT
jgi:hypothetical protein